MASLAAGIVDPTKAGKYPVVLSDALLGKDPKEILTGVRYNHKPTLSSATAPAQARIKPTSKKTPSTYDLSFQDDGGRYQYKGTRGAEDGQYVLIFDPAREVFVLHKVDSMFNMNLVQTPSNDDPKSLRREYAQLPSHSASSSAKATGGKQSGKAKNDENKKPAAKPRKPAAKPKEPKAEEKPALAMPQPKPAPKPAQKPRHTPADSEEESSDDDFGLTIENPGGAPPTTGVTGDFSPNLFGIRRFSEFIPEDEEGENDDADGEDDDEDNFEHFKLPSPIRQMQETSAPPQPTQTNESEEEEEEDEQMEDVPQPADADDGDLDDEMDLEAALMAELDGGQESDVSEEE
ncbi:RNA polymerase II transcription elongation factor-domain-containing protein [Hypomontagnella submonticulosa]|nr:RNA polymerase II transcription elongation factor-domain-containing protein [Hypomontagnella submonticulosa]